MMSELTLNSTDSHSKPPLGELSDALCIITGYLSIREQCCTRLIDQQFNEIINKSHAILRLKFHRFEFCMVDVIHQPGSQNLTILDEITSFGATMKYDEIFIRLWPVLLQKHIRNSPLFANQTKLNANRFRLALRCNIHYHNDIPVDTVSKTLVFCSKMLLRSLTSMLDSREVAVLELGCDYDSFNALVVQATWQYLSSPTRNKSVRLPPLHSVYNLHENQALYEQETKYLEKLQTECGLVIWDPVRLDNESRFRIHGFCFILNRCLWLSNWINACDDFGDPEYRWYIKTEIVLNILRDRDFENDFDIFPNESFNFYPLVLFKQIIRMRVLHLWVQHRNGQSLNRIFVRLIESNALGVLPTHNDKQTFLNDTLNWFLRILKATRSENLHLKSEEILAVAKSIYYWFMEVNWTQAAIEANNLGHVDRSGIHRALFLSQLYPNPRRVRLYFDIVWRRDNLSLNMTS